MPRPFLHRYPPQRVVFGAGRASALEEQMGESATHRAMLVCGGNTSRNRAMVDAIIGGAAGRIAHVWDGVRPHAPMETVDALVNVVRSTGCDGMVSLGGGSAHDTMRAAAMCLLSRRRISEIFQGENSYARFEPEAGVKPLSMLSIPTTLSAAETTYGGGVTTAAKKYVFYGDALYISCIVLDPHVFATTPCPILVETGLNAINHAVERLCAPTHQPIADAQFIHALKLLLPSLPRLQAEGGGQALIDAMIGAHLSESTNVLGGIGHAIAHVLGGMYKIPHGVAHGLSLIPGVRHAGPSNSNGVATVLIRFQEAGFAPIGAEGVSALTDAIRLYLQNLGLPSRLRDVGVARAAVASIARDVTLDISAARAVRDGLTAAALEPMLIEIW